MTGVRGDALRVLAFVLVTGVLLTGVGLQLSGTRLEQAVTYPVVFDDVSGLENGVDVRMAGVAVGRVDHLELQSDATVVATLSVPAHLALTEGTRATVRFKNLFGDRYVDLTDGTGEARRLEPGAVIPRERTAQALDLDELFNGFTPLLQALSPDEVNRLTGSIVAVFSGQADTVDTLLADLGSVTGTLADRDALIGSVIDNLNAVLGTLDGRRGQFDDLIVNLQQLVSGLAADRRQLGSSLERVAGLTDRTTTLLEALRPELLGAVEQTGRVSAAFNSGADDADASLQALPRVLQLLGRAGSYGSFFNFYLCGIQVRLPGPGGAITTPMVRSEVPRCTAAGVAEADRAAQDPTETQEPPR